jgi:hypothetical protein
MGLRSVKKFGFTVEAVVSAAAKQALGIRGWLFRWQTF